MKKPIESSTDQEATKVSGHLKRGVMRDLAEAEKDYSDDMERIGKQPTNKISERDRQQFINDSFTDSQGCY